LRDLIALGKLPVLLELHLTEADRVGFQRLRQRLLAESTPLTQLILLGQYLRQLDTDAAHITPEEKLLARKLQVYADLLSSGKVDLVALDDGARGRDTLDNAIAAELLAGLGADPARLMANVVARNRQADQIRSRLAHFAELGLRNALLLTGDLPVDPGKTARFPLDSIGMCDLARRMIIEGSLPEDFLIAAAGHPNPDVDPDGMHTLHKTLAGAKIIITQAIYSDEEFQNWMAALERVGVLDTAHVIAEVIPITSSNQLRTLTGVPGIRVPSELIEELSAAEAKIIQTAQAGGHDEAWVKQRRQREGARITRELVHRIRRTPGVSGFYLGCVKSFDAHLELLKETPLVPDPAHVRHRVTKLSGPARQRTLAQLPAIELFIDQLASKWKKKRRSPARRIMRRLARSAAVDRALRIIEWPKVPIFGCKGCDRCDLSPDALICPRGCAKQMTHGPCGAPRLVNGRYLCEDTSRECTWADIRERRDQWNLPVAERLEIREAPSPGFYEGETYSAFIPVLAGLKAGPDWSLAYRAPLRALTGAVRHGDPLPSSAPDLLTLVTSKAGRITELLNGRPEMDREELLIKTLVLIGTPQAMHLIETRMTELGLPAEGTLAELSIREQFRLAEALPVIRRQTANTKASRAYSAGGRPSPLANPLTRCDELLAVISEGRELRRSLRRELANGLIRHIAALGARVNYAQVLLEGRNVEDFLQALTVLKDELQMTRRAADGQPALLVQFDRVHYKHHYRSPIGIRRFHGSDGHALPKVELAVDVRQFGSIDRFRANLRDALNRVHRGVSESDGHVPLEDFVVESRGLCWAFNIAFWRRLRDFETATGTNYDVSIGGSTDHNLAYVRSTARALYDRLTDHDLGHEPVYVLEIGVASTHRAKAFLDEFRRICELSGADYINRTVYLLADFSKETLERSANTLAPVHPHLEKVLLDASDPGRALEPYRGRVIHAHVCNVFDNLPTDKAAWIGDDIHQVEARLYIPHGAVEELARKHGLSESDAAELQQRLSGLVDGRLAGVMSLLDEVRDRLTAAGKPPLAYVDWWMDLIAKLRLEERYVAAHQKLEQTLSACAGISQPLDLLRRHLKQVPDVAVHLNQGALKGFVQLAATLHPHGVLEVVDLFVQREEEYLDRFKGPAKYDGSTVNWLNGPLFRAVADELGYSVRFNSFKPFDPKSASVIMLASPNPLGRLSS